jgi:hypothetical protein
MLSLISKKVAYYMSSNSNTTIKWVNAMKNKIIIQQEIFDASNPIIGIYGIFISIDKQERCVYVGRSNNIYRRMFSGDDAHIVKLKKGIGENKEINSAMQNQNAKIIVKVLETVRYDYENYNKDMQTLASRENHYIDIYQELGQCLEQRPDGSNMEYNIWETYKNEM